MDRKKGEREQEQQGGRKRARVAGGREEGQCMPLGTLMLMTTKSEVKS